MSGTIQFQKQVVSPIPFVARLGGVVGLVAVILAVPLNVWASGGGPPALMALTFLPNVGLVIWLIGIYAYQRPQLGKLGLAGAVAAAVGLSTILGLQLIRVIAVSAPESAVNRFLQNPLLPPLLGLSMFLMIWGCLALGTTSLQSGVFPRGVVILWMAGLVILIFASWPPVILAASTGIVWASILMLRRAPAQHANPASALPVAQTTTSETSISTPRLIPLDALRGLIVALMAIDHASFFVRRWHPFEIWDQPLPIYPDLAAMLTRLATHPCAPGFYFLMGAGMLLFARSRKQHGWSEGRIAGHLVLRGLLFIVLEQFIVDLATASAPNLLEFSILSGLGIAMLFGILFLRLSGPIQAASGVAIILIMQFLPNLLLSTDLGVFTPLRALLLPGSIGPVFVLYPPIPWLGVTLLGMAFARFLLRDAERAYHLALVVGLACLVLFPVVRLLGGFGNLRMPNGNTVIDFLNVVKYPPSLSFLLLSLGFDLLMLAVFARAMRWLAEWGRPLVILGQTALYFFVIHWFIYGAFGMGFFSPGGLPETYLIWALGLVALYPICKTYEAFKHQTSASSVWRMI